MKKILLKNNKGLAVILFLSVLFSCSDNFFDVNQSQDNPSSSLPELTLPVAQKFTADYLSGGYNSINTLGNLWSYTWAATGDHIWYTDEMEYNMSSSFRTATFDNAYTAPLANYNYVEHFGEGSESEGVEYSNYRAIAKIMKVFHYQYLVDAYGDIPYTEALAGGSNPTPAYDDAEFIYSDLIAQLNNAIQLIDNGNVDPTIITPGDDDIMLGGNMDMWAKFANTIKLRILLRQSESGNSLVDLNAEYNAINNSPYGLLGSGETVYCNPGYIQEANKQNPLWNSFGETSAGNLASNNEATCVTDYFLNKLMNQYNDPRFDNLFTEATDGTSGFQGNPQNNQSATAPKAQELSLIGPGILKGPEQNAIIMGSYESLFLQAEATQRGLISNFGTAKDLYQQAISDSFSELGETSSPVSYYNQPFNNVSWDNSTNKIEAIITQKWIALCGTNGFESWVEYRRTGYPSDLPSAPDATQPTIPLRLLYPASEYSTNPNNVPPQTNTDAFNSPVFWDM